MEYRLTDDTSLENADGTLVLLRENGDAAVLDALGGKILEKLLANGIEPCVSAITRDYDIDQKTARRDIVKFRDELVRLGLIEGTS